MVPSCHLPAVWGRCSGYWCSGYCAACSLQLPWSLGVTGPVVLRAASCASCRVTVVCPAGEAACTDPSSGTSTCTVAGACVLSVGQVCWEPERPTPRTARKSLLLCPPSVGADSLPCMGRVASLLKQAGHTASKQYGHTLCKQAGRPHCKLAGRAVCRWGRWPLPPKAPCQHCPLPPWCCPARWVHPALQQLSPTPGSLAAASQ
jgi:hypothetical protein